MKAKFVGKYTDTSFGQHVVHLEYEYRGHRYTVHENLRKGNEPLMWQHRSNQDWIDRIIDTQKQTKEAESAEESLKFFFEMMENVDEWR